MNIRMLVLLVIALVSVGCASAHVTPVITPEVVGEISEPLQEEALEPLPSEIPAPAEIIAEETFEVTSDTDWPAIVAKPAIQQAEETIATAKQKPAAKQAVTSSPLPESYNSHSEVPTKTRVFIGDARDGVSVATIDTGVAQAAVAKEPVNVLRGKTVNAVAKQTTPFPVLPWTLAIVFFVAAVALFFALRGEQREVGHAEHALEDARNEAYQARNKILELQMWGKKHRARAQELEKSLAEAERANDDLAREVAEKGDRLHALMTKKPAARKKAAKSKLGKTHNEGRAVRKTKKPPGRASTDSSETVH